MTHPNATPADRPTSACECGSCGIERHLYALTLVTAPDGADYALCADCKRDYATGRVACFAPGVHGGLCDCMEGMCCLSVTADRKARKASASAWRQAAAR